jgi:hypothetical protein
MPYASVSEVPDYVAVEKRPQWREVWNSVYEAAIKDGKSKKTAEASAFRQANGVVKAVGDELHAKFYHFVQFTKVNGINHTVEGILTDETPDKSKEICDYPTSKPYYQEWSSEFHKSTNGQSLGNVREMHQLKAVGKFTSINYDDAAKAITGVAEIVDPLAWEKCEKGVYTGFSHGGAYVGTPTKEGEFKRYTAKPTEVSLVDNPCNPKAHFTYVKADGTEELRKFATVVDEVEDTKVEKLNPTGINQYGGGSGSKIHPGETAEMKRHAAEAVSNAGGPNADTDWESIAHDHAAAIGVDGDYLHHAIRQHIAARKAAGTVLNPPPTPEKEVEKPKELEKDGEVSKVVKAEHSGKMPKDWPHRPAVLKSCEDIAIAAFSKLEKSEPNWKRSASEAIAAGRANGKADADIDWESVASDYGTASNVNPELLHHYIIQSLRDEKNPPVVVTKGMSSVSRLAAILGQLAWLKWEVANEQQREGDIASPLPAALQSELSSIADTLVSMAQEEARELVQTSMTNQVPDEGGGLCASSPMCCTIDGVDLEKAFCTPEEEERWMKMITVVDGVELLKADPDEPVAVEMIKVDGVTLEKAEMGEDELTKLNPTGKNQYTGGGGGHIAGTPDEHRVAADLHHRTAEVHQTAAYNAQKNENWASAGEHQQAAQSHTAAALLHSDAASTGTFSAQNPNNRGVSNLAQTQSQEARDASVAASKLSRHAYGM